MKIEADWTTQNEPPSRFPDGKYLVEVSAVETRYSRSGKQQLKLTLMAVEHELKFLCSDLLTFDPDTKAMSMAVAKLKMLGGPFDDTEDIVGRRCYVHIKRRSVPTTDTEPAKSYLNVDIYGSDHCGYERCGPAPTPKVTGPRPSEPQAPASASADDCPF